METKFENCSTENLDENDGRVTSRGHGIKKMYKIVKKYTNVITAEGFPGGGDLEIKLDDMSDENINKLIDNISNDSEVDLDKYDFDKNYIDGCIYFGDNDEFWFNYSFEKGNNYIEFNFDN